LKIVLLCLLFAAFAVLMTCARSGPIPPVAKTEPHELEAHGDLRVDDYYWLRERTDPEVVAYLETEKGYIDAVMAGTETTKERLFQEIKGRIKQTDSTPPAPDHGHLYYHRTEDGKEYKIHCRRKDAPDAEEEILVDDNLLLFRTIMDAGHGGASGRYEEYREIAEEYTFILMIVGSDA
jgi:oligopeptidase B